MSIIQGNSGLSVSGQASSPPAYPLDYMSVQPIAAWWTRKLFAGNVADDITAQIVLPPSSQNIPFAPNGILDTSNLHTFGTTNDCLLDVWRDQLPPGSGLNLSGGNQSQGPLIYNGTTQLTETLNGHPAANFRSTDSLGRNDGLGLLGDPAITFAWVMQTTNLAIGNFPTLFTLGNAGELDLYFDRDVSNDYIYVAGAVDGVNWALPLNSLNNTGNFIIRKNAGINWSAGGWQLSINGIDHGNPTSSGPSLLILTDSRTMLGDFVGGGFPWVGKLPGMIIYNSVIAGNNLSILQSFLTSQT